MSTVRTPRLRVEIENDAQNTGKYFYNQFNGDLFFICDTEPTVIRRIGRRNSIKCDNRREAKKFVIEMCQPPKHQFTTGNPAEE
tara:strand:- start:2853 stop:3104 length:252 start_codon:yes stop_codon:yes gene_type:complete